MKVLAFDTSTKFLSVACLEDGRQCACFHEEAGIRHSEILVATIKSLLEEAAWRVQQLDLVCVGLGPGSFTGLRIGVATVKALAAATAVKAVGVPSMDASAVKCAHLGAKIAPFLDAHKGKVYTAVYSTTGKLPRRDTDYLLTDVEEFLAGLKEDVVLFGSGVIKYKKQLELSRRVECLEDIDWYPHAADIARLGTERAAKAEANADKLDPMYMHSKYCNVTEPRKENGST
ncbi:MAG: tRNA (adenosine(37)-N6)-threonylcarbamoyltransferase complex dimerization subunit type 1 TsaB [Candidatus Omnitrophica bacterium]|nr:tRNA (adenosine(37)-N6)-threonylcarbamoyltransferase complex dimerization subunit type 1 TsaB [Candidatus Omnitrophota bacterium]